MTPWNSFLTGVLVAVALFLGAMLCVAMGLEMGNKRWQNDCAQLGSHRGDDGVYDCSKRGPR